MKIETLSVPASATATSRLPSPLKSPTAIAEGSSSERDRRVAGRGGGLEGPVAGTQVNAVRGHDVEDAVIGEVADGDRRESRNVPSSKLAGEPSDPGPTTGSMTSKASKFPSR